MFIDTHCHLSLDYYDDIDKVLNDNHDMGVSKIIVSGCDKKVFFLLISIVIYMLVLDFIQILLRRLYKKI